MSISRPWLKPGLTDNQRAAAFFPEIGLRGDVGDLAEAFAQHATEAVADKDAEIERLTRERDEARAAVDSLSMVLDEACLGNEADRIAQMKTIYAEHRAALAGEGEA